MEDTLYRSLLNISYALSFSAIFIIIITTGVSGESSLIALISGYSTLLLSIFFLLFLTYNTYLSNNNVKFNSISSIMSLVRPFFPSILIIFVLTLLITFLSIYFQRIALGNVPDYYYSFSNMSTILLLMQLGVWFHAIYKNSGKIDEGERVFSILTLVGTINSIVVITLGIVLKYYSTDC
jgi:hypothetical protein